MTAGAVVEDAVEASRCIILTSGEEDLVSGVAGSEDVDEVRETERERLSPMF
jgi:hypothetical protein